MKKYLHWLVQSYEGRIFTYLVTPLFVLAHLLNWICTDGNLSEDNFIVITTATMMVINGVFFWLINRTMDSFSRACGVE